ncbi:MAG: hypothetical protein ACJARI_001754 [Bacteroidia bacterium]
MEEKVGVARLFILYGTSACHLCEMAEELMVFVNDGRGELVYEKCDIANSDELFERYGLHIPVLQHPGGDELFWPFDSDALRDFCEL